jgi:dihydrofolate reductase
MKISMVVAASTNNAIGLKGKLLWNLPKDTKFFKDITRGHHVLMGRKSWEALPDGYRPLPGRVNIVVTRQNNFRAEGCVTVKGIDEGIEFARKSGEEELMIIGGGEIYKQALAKTDRIYLTRVHHSFTEADAFFPELPGNEWKEVSVVSNQADEKHKYAFDFVVLERT